MSAIVGIIGGMGPLSTVELMKKIVESTPVKIEQEHIRMLVDNRPQIPDRTDYILGKGPSPIPMLQNSAVLLQDWGADLLAIACNTAHVFVENIKAVVKIPVLNMLAVLARDLEEKLPVGNEVFLLTTSGALKTGIFQQYLWRFNLRVPPQAIQDNIIMDIIYGKEGIKTAKNLDHNQKRISDYIESLSLSHETVILAGCTEIGLVLDEAQIGRTVVNPLGSLALEIVKQALL